MSNIRGVRRELIKVIIFAVASVIVTVSVVATLLDLKLGQASGSYKAMFSNASGLQAGDTVRIAGIEVGKVNGVKLKGDNAEVDFTVAKTQHLTTSTRATVQFENLLGQRNLGLIAGSDSGSPLPTGATIPMSRTTPGLDLTAVFTGFQPLLAALNPQQINQLTGSIIAVFQGQSGAVGNLVTQTASLTGNLAQRSDVINQVLDNLAPLLRQVNTQDSNLGTVIDSFETVVKGLAADNNNVGPAISGVSHLTQNLSATIGQSQPYIDQDLNQLVGATQVLAANEGPLANVLRDLSPFLGALNKVADHGSYLSVYICDLTVNFSGPVSTKLSPTVPQSPPLTLPGGVVGNRFTHFPVCR